MSFDPVALNMSCKKLNFYQKKRVVLFETPKKESSSFSNNLKGN